MKSDTWQILVSLIAQFSSVDLISTLECFKWSGSGWAGPSCHRHIHGQHKERFLEDQEVDLTDRLFGSNSECIRLFDPILELYYQQFNQFLFNHCLDCQRKKSGTISAAALEQKWSFVIKGFFQRIFFMFEKVFFFHSFEMIWSKRRNVRNTLFQLYNLNFFSNISLLFS